MFILPLTDYVTLNMTFNLYEQHFLHGSQNIVISQCVVCISCSVMSNWTIASQAPLSMKFSRQEHWSGLPCPSPGDLPNSGIEPRSPALQADS